jgi:hypothetical protein
MAASAWYFYDEGKKAILEETIDLVNNDLKMALFTSSYTPLATQTGFASLTNEVAEANGYTAGGALLTGKAVGLVSTSQPKFTSNPVQWIATGGPITARYAVLYDDTSTGKILIAYCLLDTTPADVTAADTLALVITPASSGYFYIS